MHGGEVREHAAQPAMVHEWHANPLRLVRDRFLGLLLSTDEHDRAAVGDRLTDELVGPVNVGQRLLQVDDVDAVALGEDVALHLRIPTAGLVTKMHAGVEQLLHGDDGHRRCTPRYVGRTGSTGALMRLSRQSGLDRRPGARPTSGPRAITTAARTAGHRSPGGRSAGARSRPARGPPLYSTRPPAALRAPPPAQFGCRLPFWKAGKR